MGAMIPPSEKGLPPLASLDARQFWQRFEGAAPRSLKIGLRVAVWVLTWLPLFSFRYRRPLQRLSPARRDQFLRGMYESRFYLMRQLVEVVKLVATLAYFHDDAVREYFGEDLR